MSADYAYPLGLFDAYGVELEYMIVDSETLDVRPVADRLFEAAAGSPVSDHAPDGENGAISWSNELALHVVELKTQHPASSLEGLEDAFQDHVGRINGLLAPMGCRLMPTGMHPWMDPDREMRLWPHEFTEVYHAYDRIFGCKGHGWANLQSTHVNLPFRNDEEFGRLHAAIRLVLPLIPALAASSPVVEGRVSALTDHRMEVYRTNSLRVPMMAGLVVPEPVYTREAYERDILGRLYEDLGPLDPDGVLRHEFANARGGMARFDRGAIEIRVIDIQECPAADLSVVRLVCAAVRALVEERWMSYGDQQKVETGVLHGALLATIRDGGRTRFQHQDWLAAFGVGAASIDGRTLWAELAGRLLPGDAGVRRVIAEGTLSERIRVALRDRPGPEGLRGVYAELCECLREGRLFGVD